VREALQSVCGGGLPQSEGGNISCSHDWDALIA